MVPRIIKYKGRCYLLTECPQQGSHGPGDTSEEGKETKELDKDILDVTHEDEVEEDYSRDRSGYKREVGRPAPESVPLSTPTKQLVETPVLSDVKAIVESPEIAVTNLDSRLPDVEINHVPVEIPIEYGVPVKTPSGAEITPISDEDWAEMTVRYQPRLSENLVYDTMSSGAKLLNGMLGDARATYDDLDVMIHSSGGPGVKYVDVRTGEVGDSVAPERVLPKTVNRLSRPIAKANAALLAVDAANVIWDGYEYGAFDTVESAADYLTEVVQAIPDSIVQMGTDTVDAVLNDKPEVLVDVATNIIGVPSALKLFDRVASAVTGDDVNIGAQTVDAIIDNAPKSIWIKPSDLGFGPKLDVQDVWLPW